MSTSVIFCDIMLYKVTFYVSLHDEVTSYVTVYAVILCDVILCDVTLNNATLKSTRLEITQLLYDVRNYLSIQINYSQM